MPVSVVAEQQGDLDHALKTLQTAVVKGMTGKVTLINLGNLYARKSNFPQAIESFELAERRIREIPGCSLRSESVISEPAPLSRPKLCSRRSSVWILRIWRRSDC
jgi:hypothetical protein